MEFYRGNSFDLFADEYKKQVENEINSQNDSYILNVNTDDFTDHLFQRYVLDFPEIHFDNAYIDTKEQDIPGSRFPSGFMITDPQRLFRKQVIIYHLPFTGNIKLLQLRPNPMILMGYEAKIDNRQQCILIEIINFSNDPEEIKKTYNQEIHYLSGNYTHLKNNCEAFNKGLKSTIKISINQRREKILQQNNLLASLGVPIKKKDSVAETFLVPNPKLKEKIIVKPIVHEKGFTPEPALDDENFQKILKIINDVGKNFERLPSTYKGKSEEDIRDHILLILDPNFELGSAGGETFNKIGKTDISLRYDSNVVFIAECKYWRGEKMFLETIDQLLGYLTWRNSKVAIINFVQNVEFSEVLSKVKAIIKTHPNHLKELRDRDETWFNCKFHLNNDRNRELDLSVISFHLPK
jgi:hypothetical protein